MMNRKHNPYEELLNFFDEVQIKKPIKSSKKIEVKKEEHLNDTKKFIEDSKIYGYIPNKKIEKERKKSDGFNVSKFESLMRVKLIEDYKKAQSYERPYISVSELCSCLRKCYYERKKYDVDVKSMFQFSYLYFIQRVGDTIHDTIQSLYNFSETEKTIVSDIFKVKGRIDGIKNNFLYEIKSIDETKLFNIDYIEEHFIQANIYAYILNSEYDYKITTVTLIYVPRKLKEIIPVDIAINEKVAKSILEKAPILKHHLDKNKVPDPFGATKDICTFCSYKNYCIVDQCDIVERPFQQKIKQSKIKKKDELFIEANPIKKKDPNLNISKDDKITFLL